MSDSILVLICAKKESRRFKYKNRKLIKAVVKDIVRDYRDYGGIKKDIVIATDCPDIRELYRDLMNTKVLHRPLNCCYPEDSVFDIAKWAYMSLDKRYSSIAITFANVINFKATTIDKAHKKLVDFNLKEVRSYDKHGRENGLILSTEEQLMYGRFSTYCGAITSDAVEIHHEGELDDYN